MYTHTHAHTHTRTHTRTHTHVQHKIEMILCCYPNTIIDKYITHTHTHTRTRTHTNNNASIYRRNLRDGGIICIHICNSSLLH